jgi:hypothetical protein
MMAVDGVIVGNGEVNTEPWISNVNESVAGLDAKVTVQILMVKGYLLNLKQVS